MKKIMLFVAMAVLLSPLCASAATTGVANVTLTIPAIVNIALNGAAATVTPAAATLAEMLAGQMTAINGGQITVDANVTWNLSVHADAATFTGTGNNAKVVNALQVKVAPGGAYIALNADGTTAVQVLGPAVAAESATAHNVLYQFTAGFGDLSGTYITTLTYTIAN